MQTTTILFLGQDKVFERTLRPVVDGIGGCQLEMATEIDAAALRLQRGNVGMLVAHVTDPASQRKLAEFLSTHVHQQSRESKLPVVVLSDSDDPAIRLSFLRLKALDCLARPIDLSRLALLIDLTTADRRFGQTAVAKNATCRQQVSCIDGLVCATPAMERLFAQARSAGLERTLYALPHDAKEEFLPS